MVVLAEKPSVALSIAKILGATKKNDGFYSNSDNSIFVTWAFGHLIELAKPETYNENFKKWNLNDLPIFPEKFIFQIKNDSGVRKQFKIIKNLFSKANKIINATDAGREGELIFRLIYNQMKINKPIFRLWISSMTDEAIKKGFENLKDNSFFDNLYLSAAARSYSDWLIGINLTRAFTLYNKSKSVLSLGRVQTPTLYMISKSYLENKNFKPKKYFVPGVLLKDYSLKAFLINDEKFFDKTEIEKTLNKIKNNQLVLEEIKKEKKKELPPNLFDLTSLQREANKKFGLSAQKTLDITQSLYEKYKIVSYPRTDSKYLNLDQYQDVLNVKDLIKSLYNINETFKIEKNNKRIFNNNKVTDHHAIIPVDNQNLNKIYFDLDENHKNIFNLIAQRFLEALNNDFIFETIKYIFAIDDLKFSSTFQKPINLGWKGLFKIKEKNEVFEIKKPYQTFNYNLFIEEKQTQAPPVLTEALLLKYMENVHLFFKENKDDLQNIKKTGIGTPATRAAIIELLKKRNYVTLLKNKLIPTETGLFIFEITKNQKIASPLVTANMETYLKLIEEGKASDNKFLEKIKIFVKQSIDNISKNHNSEKINSIQNHKEIISDVKCPKCKTGDIIIGKKNYYCSNYPNCDFGIYNKYLNKKLSQTTIKKLIKRETTKKIKGFKSKAGKTFDARIKLNMNNFKIELDFTK